MTALELIEHKINTKPWCEPAKFTRDEMNLIGTALPPGSWIEVTRNSFTSVSYLELHRLHDRIMEYLPQRIADNLTQ